MNIFNKIFKFLDKKGVFNFIDGIFYTKKDQIYIPIDKAVYEKYKNSDIKNNLCCGLHDIKGKKILLHHFMLRSKVINHKLMEQADIIVSCHSRFLPKKYRHKALFISWGKQTSTVVHIPNTDDYALYVAPLHVYHKNFCNKKTTVNQQ